MAFWVESKVNFCGCLGRGCGSTEQVFDYGEMEKYWFRKHRIDREDVEVCIVHSLCTARKAEV